VDSSSSLSTTAPRNINRFAFPLQQTTEKFYNKLIKCGVKNYYFLDNNLNLTLRKMVVKFQSNIFMTDGKGRHKR